MTSCVQCVINKKRASSCIWRSQDNRTAGIKMSNAQCTTVTEASVSSAHAIRVRNPRVVPPDTPRNGRQWMLQLSLAILTILTLSLVTHHTFYPRRCCCCCLQLVTMPLCKHSWNCSLLSGWQKFMQNTVRIVPNIIQQFVVSATSWDNEGSSLALLKFHTNNWDVNFHIFLNSRLKRIKLMVLVHKMTPRSWQPD